MMYYDLIASLPHLPHFEQALSLPISSLRLKQRLTRLQPEHSDQLDRAESLVHWRPMQLIGMTDARMAAGWSRLMDSTLDQSLRDYIAMRMNQQTLLAAIRRKGDGAGWPEAGSSWGVGPQVHVIHRHWEIADFGLQHVYPWLPAARELMKAGDARGMERLLSGDAWKWLTHCAERNMFGFEAVFAYVFKWDILRSWLACDMDRAKIRFAELVDKVTRVDKVTQADKVTHVELN